MIRRTSIPRSLRLAALLAVLAIVLAACGGDPTPTPRPTSTPLPAQPTATSGAQEAPATPTPTADPFLAEWDALIAAAQAEGEVILVFGGSAGRNYRPLAEFFGEKFGINAIVSTGSGSAQGERILAEQQAGQYEVGIMMIGATTGSTRLVPGGAVEPLAPLFMHPEVLDQSLWFQGRHWYADTEQTFMFTLSAGAEPQNMGMRYSTELMTQEDIDGFNSVFDYLDLKWAGKIVSLAPLAGGAAGTLFEAYLHPDIGPGWVDRFMAPELDVTFTEDFRFITDGVARGQFHFGIAIGSAGRDLDALEDAGAKVKRLVKDFKEGGVLGGTGSSNTMMVPPNRPHPNAAKLWVNWFLSKEGATAMHELSEQSVSPTLRLDVTSWGKTNEFERRIDGQDYFFFGSDPQYTVRREEGFAYIEAAYNASR